jgi:flavin reductase (DIM6/NTAB) family NADH-FMN oxidoreductase RutF
MQRSGAATRRFYAAFYQLTVRSANRTRPCVAGASLVSRRPNSTTSETSWNPDRLKNSHKRPQSKSFVVTTGLLQDEPIQSTAECPFASLEAWGHAIRERSLSSNSVTVEISVPSWVLKAQDVVQHARTHGVQVRISEYRSGKGHNKLRPVILSGDPVKVKEVWEIMHQTEPQVSQPKTPQPFYAVDQSTGEVSGPEPWTYALNDKAVNFEADFCIPDSVWRPLAEHGCAEWFRQEYHVQTGVLGARGDCTFLRLTGEPKLIRKSIKFLLKTKIWTDGHAQQRYEFIRDSVSQRLALSPAPPKEYPSPFEEYRPRVDGPETREALRTEDEQTQSTRPAPLKEFHSKEGGPRIRRVHPTENEQMQNTHPSPLKEPHSKEGGLEIQKALGLGKKQPKHAHAQSDAKVRMTRFYVPRHSRRVFEADNSPIAQIQQDSGLQALRYRPMAGSRYYLQLIGTSSAIDRATLMLGQVILPEDDGAPVYIERLRISESKFQPPDPTWFAWIKLPNHAIDMASVMFEMKHSLRANDCEIQKFRKAGDRDLMVRGTKSAVKLAIADLQNVINERRVKNGWPIAELEVHKKGSIQYIEKETPWADMATKSQAQSESAAKDVKQKEAKVPLASAGARREENNANRRMNDKMTDVLRSALRHLTQPVALITSTLPGDEAARSSPRGVTVSSFCTVTLEHKPIISFNLRVPSRTWDAIEKSQRLSVSLLAASPEGAAAAHAFAMPYEQPHEPFERLENLGASVMTNTGDGTPPDITWPGAVNTRISASLWPDKCVLVGDHMIVVAKVHDVLHDEKAVSSDAGALAYGMRGYRRLGGEIKPAEGGAAAPEVEVVEPVEEKLAKIKPVEKQPAPTAEVDEQAQSNLWKGFMEDFMEDLESDDRKPAETQGSSASTDPAAHQQEQASKGLTDIGPSSPIMDEESLRQVLEETEESYSSKGLPSKTANGNPMLAEALKAAAGAYDETPDAKTPSSTTSTPPNRDATTSSSPDASQDKTPSNHSQNVSNRPWGMGDNNKPSNRTFSTWTRSQTRSYSTSNDPKSPPSDKILKSTVEDFLCQIPTNNRLYNNLIAAQRQAEKLEKLVADNKVPAEEIAKVEAESQAIRRRVARELAWRNAQDLRVLLDQGHVSPERAQWLETNLEQGQAVLLQEAKLLRKELEEERLVKEEFEGAKAALMKDYEEFEALLKRLRDFVDEDDVSDGGQGHEAGSASSGRP